MTKADRVYLYDSMLRDGVQAQGVDLSAVDKQEIARDLDALGIDYIEGGWPGANPTDDRFFADLPKLKHSRITAFGMTRKANTGAYNDPGLNALVNSGVKHICIVGKTWDFHVTHALEVPLEENLNMIRESVAYLVSKDIEVLFDAEHFFDGYKANPDYALSAIKTAYEAGARWIVLCDTNGGTLPHEVEEIVHLVAKDIPGNHLGIHCHNDTENAVANSIAAVRAGVRQVQGTLNGWGERGGNANLITIIGNLGIKMGYDVGVTKENMKKLTQISHALDDRLNRTRYPHAAYVGSAAFAHKGGLHVSAVVKNPAAYEHVDPELVGNERVVLVSDQAGRSNIIRRLKSLSLDVDFDDKDVKDKINALMDEIKERENQGWAYDSADASFELLAHQFLGDIPQYYAVESFRIIDDRTFNNGDSVRISEATVKMEIDGKRYVEVSEGNGPVNALNRAMKKALLRKYDVLKGIRLTDYKVRIITPERGTEAVTRVQVETTDNEGHRWTTVGVSANIIDASYQALDDAIIYKLFTSE